MNTPYFTGCILAEIVLWDSYLSIQYLPIAARDSNINSLFVVAFIYFYFHSPANVKCFHSSDLGSFSITGKMPVPQKFNFLVEWTGEPMLKKLIENVVISCSIDRSRSEKFVVRTLVLTSEGLKSSLRTFLITKREPVKEENKKSSRKRSEII
jgi:hypothetical protein